MLQKKKKNLKKTENIEDIDDFQFSQVSTSELFGLRHSNYLTSQQLSGVGIHT